MRAPLDLLEHPPRGREAPPGPRRYRAAALIASAVVLVAAGSLAIVAASHGAKPTTSRHPSAATARALATAWVARQVSPTATVSCDPAMCRALRARGVDKVLPLGPATPDPLHSQVIVATAAVRQELGARLNSVYAPAVIASFGSGSARIDIRMIAPDGPGAFRSALNTDLQSRRQAGALLLTNSRVTASATARRQMLAGQVSGQLLILITNMAAAHPVDILAFGGSAPGASPGIPLRSVMVAETGTADVRSMFSVFDVQVGAFRPAHVVTTRQDGHPALLIEYLAPSPLGLVASS